MELIDQPADALTAPNALVRVAAPPDERLARRALRAQIAHLERELGAHLACLRPPGGDRPAPALAGPRLLSLGELELLRDDLADRLHAVLRAAEREAERQEAARELIEHMLLEPHRHRWMRVTNEDIGEEGCRSWHVRPRLGLLGMLMGWWRVKISSGCPLPEGPRPRPWPRFRPALP